MSDQLNRMEEMLATLIKMNASTNAKVDDLSKEMKDIKAELKEDINEVRETLHTYDGDRRVYAAE